MLKAVHRAAAILAPLCIATFFLSTLFTELFGSHVAIARLKALIVSGLWVLVPALVITGVTGMLLAKSRSGRLVSAKKTRMPIIAMTGLLVLLPCAVFLNRWAQAGSFDSTFYLVQIVELLAGGINLTLIGLNFHAGLRLSGRLRPQKAPGV